MKGELRLKVWARPAGLAAAMSHTTNGERVVGVTSRIMSYKLLPIYHPYELIIRPWTKRKR
jgi:hypothetical protein